MNYMSAACSSARNRKRWSERRKGSKGVEVMTTTPEGHIVTVVERDTDAALADVFQEIQNSDGVLSASLVYHYSDNSNAQDGEVTS
jgi:nitrate reductase NapAB chaperone NapD